MNLFPHKSGAFANLSQGVRGVVAGWVAKSMGWQQAMFGDLMDGGGSEAADLKRPYARSAWVRSAIQFVSGPISMRPLKITADKRGGDVVIDDAALTKFWETPAKTSGGLMSRQDFIEALVGLLKLKGQAFLIMDESWFKRGAAKTPLWLARADSMHAVVENGELIGWAWTEAKGRKTALGLPQVIHLKFWNPYHDVLGLSEWEAAMIAAEADYAAGTFARNLARNNGDRGPFVIGKGGVFSDDQIKQITAQLRAKRELNRRGDFRAAFIPGDVDVKEPGINAVDAAYVAQRLENRKEVYIALGVPPSFADPQASYSIGSASDRFRLIEDTCMPLGAKIADAFERVSALFLGDGKTIFVEFDWDSHSTMQQVRSERFETATKAIDRGMPWREASEYFGLKLPRFAGDDVGRIPFNLQEIEKASGQEPAGSSEVVVPDPVDELAKLFTQRALANAPMPAAGERTITVKEFETWKRIHKSREAWEKKYLTKIKRHLMDARGETLRKISAAAGMEKALHAKGWNVMDLIFDLDAWMADWVKGLIGVSRNAIEAAGMELWKEELQRDDALVMPAQQVLDALAGRENRIKDAGTKVWEAIKSDLEEGLTKGETMDELADRVRAKFGGMERERGVVIAKTETTVIYEMGRDMVFQQAGVQWTQWLCSGLGNERPSHLGANLQIQPMGTKFNVGGYELAFPGDPEGPAKEVINCNCVRIAVASPEGGDITGNNDNEIPY